MACFNAGVRAAASISPSASTHGAGCASGGTGRSRAPGFDFGMKVHVGASKQGLVHSVATGPANEADITRLDDLLHGEEVELYGDQAYGSENHRLQCKHAGIGYRMNRRARPGQKLTEHKKSINRSRSRCRARGRGGH